MTLVTPIIKLPNSSLYVTETPVRITTLSELSHSLIPSLTLIGVLFTPPLSTEHEELIKSSIRNKNTIIKPYSSKQELNLVDIGSLVKVQGNINIDIRFSYDKSEDINKIIQKEIQKVRQTTLIEGNRVWGYTKESLIGEVEEKVIKVNFLLPNIRMPQYLTVDKSTSFVGTVPITFLVHCDCLSAAEIIDVFSKQLSLVLRTMIKNNLPYRSVENKVPGIITENYSQTLILKEAAKSVVTKTNQVGPKSPPIAIIIGVLVACVIVYIGLKSI